MKRSFVIKSNTSKDEKRLKDIFTITNRFPTEYSTKLSVTPVFNQGKGGMCVACSLSLLYFILRYKRTVIDNEIVDPVDIYGNRYEESHLGKGMKINEAIQYTIDNGVYFDSLFSTLSLFETVYNGLTYEESLKYCANNKDRKRFPIINYYYSVHNINEIKSAIINFGACILMIPIYHCYKYPTKQINDYYVEYSLQEYESEPEYFHTVVISGWKYKYWKAHNTWGEKFGNNGVTYLSFDYPIIEGWVCVDKFDDTNYGLQLLSNTNI